MLNHTSVSPELFHVGSLLGVSFMSSTQKSPLFCRDNPRIQEKIDSVTAGFQGGTKMSSLKTICLMM